MAQHNVTPFSQEDWSALATAAKFKLNKNGNPEGVSDGRILEIAAPNIANFDVRVGMLRAYVQFLLTRVGQNAIGNVQDAVTKATTTGETLPAVRITDAEDEIWRAYILGQMRKAQGDEKYSPPAALLQATCDKYKAARFDKVIAAVRANTTREADGDKKPRAGKKTDAMDLGNLD